MPKIITITLNTAIDNIVEIDRFTVGSVVKGNSYFVQSGKGINVARAAASLKVPTIAMGYVGSKDYDFFNELNSNRLTIDLDTIEERTRTNISLLDSDHNLIIHARTSGYNLKPKQLKPLEDKLEKTIKKGDVVAISGSVPNPSISKAYYKLIKICKRLGATIILDTSGDEFREGIRAIPDIIKPNVEELEILTSKTLTSEKEIVLAAKSLNKLGISLVFVSMGIKGVILTKNEIAGYWKASINERLSGYPGMEIGCGDSMVAGIASQTIKKSNISKLLHTAIGSATANLFAKSPGKLNNSIVAKYAKKANVEYIEI